MAAAPPSNHSYEVIVIGAGIGGLTAGTYLAKSGCRVLIVEQARKVGGYCGSFDRGGYRFDEAVHYINNFGPRGFLRNICRELGIEDRVQVLTIDPSDRLVMPGIQVAISHDVQRTVEEISKTFPREASSIKRFFHMITDFDFSALYVKCRRMTFQQLLDEYFQDRRLKTALGLFATTMGLTADKLAALSALAYYKGSILDGGYHPVGGAQTFSNALQDRFVELGGELMLGKKVASIQVSGGQARGVTLEDGTRLAARAIISNCDATQTFTKLIGEESVGTRFIQRLKKLKPSASTLVVYLGVNRLLQGEVPDCCNLWYFPYEDSSLGSINIVEDDRKNGFVHIGLSSLHDRTMAPSNCESLVLFCGATFKTEKYWSAHRQRLADILVERACQAIPRIRDAIQIKLPATPYTLFRYTLNRNGAYRGWEPTTNQAQASLVPQKTDIDGLYLAGHWVTTPVGNGGVSMVAQSGKNAARLVAQSFRHRPDDISTPAFSRT